jgi:hypothetical protein
MIRVALVALGLGVASMAAAAQADARHWNPPGPAGGPGTNWRNPPGPAGGPGAGPYYRYAAPGGLYWHPRGYWCRFDRDDNPPGPRGGRGTNWENPPGPRGGPGASPNSRYRRC